MAFANLFTSLSAADEDASTPCELAFLGRKPRELEPFEREMGNGEIDHAKERPLGSEQQSGSKNKRKRIRHRRQSNQAKRVKTHEALLSYRDYDAEAKDYHMVKCGYEQPSLNFNKELNVYCHSDNADETNTVQNGSARKNKNEYFQHKIKKCDSNQHSQSDRGGHSNRGECHRGTYGRDSHVRGRGRGANNCDKRIGRNHGCAIWGRDVPVKNDRSKSGGNGTDQMGRFGGIHKPQRGGQQYRGKGRRSNHASYQCVQAERKRFMTQEFKEQNVLEVDGRFICRHFLHGRCIKGDECQLEHTQDVHNLIKEVCKFYVQGSCTKGENCPYMHKSFPCKFFHTRGKCFQGAECRFSHEPLTDITRQLLEAALKRDNDISEMAKKDQPVNSGQPKNTKESLSTEDSVTPDNSTPAIDILLYPIRPNFYNSSCPSEPHTEKMTPLCHTGGLANVTDKDTVPPHATDSTPAHSHPSSHSTCKESVSYSVEAVLGSQKPKPLPSVFTSPSSQESIAHSSQQRSLDCPSISANQEEAPYSVNVVLGSRKAVEKSICGLSSGPITMDSCTPPAQTRPCTTMTGFGLQEMPQPPTSVANHNGKVSYSVDIISESYKPLESPVKSLCAGSAGQIPGAQKPTERAFYGVSAALIGRTYSAIHHTKPNRHLTRDIAGPQDTIQPTKSTDPTMSSEDGRSKSVLPVKPVVGPNKPTHRPFHSLFSSPPAPKHPTQMKQHLPRVLSGLQDSVQSHDPSLRFTDCKSGVAVPTETVSGSHKASVLVSPGTEKCALTEIQQRTPRIPSGPQNYIQSPDPNPNSTDCKSKMTLHVESAVGPNKPLERPFHSLFASCISATPSQLPSIQTKPDSIRTPLCPQESIDSTYSTPISMDYGGKVIPLKTVVEPSKATERPFLGLFASPLSKSAVQLPSIQTKSDTPMNPLHPQVYIQVDDSTSSSRDCKDKTPNLKTLFAGPISKDLTDTSPAPRSLGSLPGSKSKKGKGSYSAECINDSPRQLENPTCSLFTDPVGEMSTFPIHTDTKLGSSRTQADQLQPDVSSHQVSSKTSTTNSILKTLFLRLSPCRLFEEQQGNIQDSVYSESENKDETPTGSTFTEPQWKIEEEERIEGELREEMMQEPENCLLLDEPVEIPLEPSPCVSLCDPRQPLQVEVALLKPTFAHNVVWSPFDLVPLPPLSQHQSVVHQAQGSQELSVEKTTTPLNPAGHLQEAVGDSNSRSAGVTEVQLSAPGLHNLPIKSVALMTKAYPHLPSNPLSGQKKCLKRNLGDKPLKEIFRTFDPTASPFGQ